MAKRQRSGEVSLFLGGGSSLEGALNFKGQARLDGHFKGSIKGSGELLVGPTAVVEADIQCTSVIISGQVIGDITASDRLELRAPGQLKGDISAPLVVMDEGVLYEGHCSMAADQDADRAPNITLLAGGEK